MDLEIAKKEFINYTNEFDLNDFNIKRKVDHSLRVMAISKEIAKSINLSEDKINLAMLIGLLHDIGRFEQVRKYNTFIDRISIDHGNYGVEVLKKDNYIRKYIKEEKYDNIIFKAIKNHNKYMIEEGLSEEELLFTKIIRDADKIDITYQGTCISWASNKEIVEETKLTRNNINAFTERRLLNRNTDLNNINNAMGHLLIVLGFVFDINYKKSFEIIKENDYMNMIINRFDFKEEDTKLLIDEALDIVNSYIDSKV